MAVAALPLITIFTSTTTTTSPPSFPPKPRVSKLLISCKHHQIQFKITRREASLLSLLAVSQPPPAAAAFSIGISGPKEWLKEQKKKASKFLLAPIDASREILLSAFSLLMNEDSNHTAEELEEIQKLLRSAARDCVPQEWNSFVTFQANTGVEVCTFKLILKNASSLLDDKDPVKLKAENMLNDLIRSFVSLNSLANQTDIQLTSSRQNVADALMDTVSSLDKLEQSIKECLEV